MCTTQLTRGYSIGMGFDCEDPQEKRTWPDWRHHRSNLLGYWQRKPKRVIGGEGKKEYFRIQMTGAHTAKQITDRQIQNIPHGFWLIDQLIISSSSGRSWLGSIQFDWCSPKASFLCPKKLFCGVLQTSLSEIAFKS